SFDQRATSASPLQITSTCSLATSIPTYVSIASIRPPLPREAPASPNLAMMRARTQATVRALAGAPDPATKLLNERHAQGGDGLPGPALGENKLPASSDTRGSGGSAPPLRFVPEARTV